MRSTTDSWVDPLVAGVWVPACALQATLIARSRLQLKSPDAHSACFGGDVAGGRPVAHEIIRSATNMEQSLLLRAIVRPLRLSR